MNLNNHPTMNPEEFTDISSREGLIEKVTLFLVLLSVYLIPWGDGFWDGTVRVGATLALGTSLIYFFIKGTQKNYSFFHLVIVLYIAWLVLSLAWTTDYEWGSGIAKTTLQLILMSFMYTLIIDNKKKVEYAYQAYIFGNITGSGIIIYNFVNGIESQYYGRYGIVNIETDTLSIILAMTIPMAAYLATKQNNKVLKSINLLSIPLVFYAIFLTGTRTGSIVGVLGLVYWIFTYRKSSIIIKSFITLVMVASVIAIITFAPKASIDRVLSAGESISSGTLNNRTIIWGGALEQWKKTPIIGTGIGGLGDALNKLNIRYRDAHNSFIHLLTENGIIGLLLYLLIFISLFYYSIHTPFDEKIFLVTLLMCIFLSQQSTHTHFNKFAWFVFTMVAIHSFLYSSKPDKP